MKLKENSESLSKNKNNADSMKQTKIKNNVNLIGKKRVK